MSNTFHRNKDGLAGFLAAIRFPLCIAAGIGVTTFIWSPLPSNGEIGFLGVLIWSKFFLVFIGIGVALLVNMLLKYLGTEIIDVTSVAEVIQIALDQYRAPSRVTVRCIKCDEKLSADRVRSPADGRHCIQLLCQCGACNSIHPLYSKSASYDN
ncbi:hypothetical protein [Undibacterium sp.]|uniref:hypothetical protein n=1 Tax=Undibacterium sp. TaxID=1914977 RepID=UPI0037511AD3